MKRKGPGAGDARNDPRSRKGGSRERESSARDFRALQRGLTGDRALIGVSYMDSPELLRAYLDFYWPISFEQTRRAIAVASFLLGTRLRAERVIDAGSGPGPVAAEPAVVQASVAPERLREVYGRVGRSMYYSHYRQAQN